jgi:hypothetical protein
MEQTPSVGRIVHYVSRGSADGKFPSVCRAAVITETYGARPTSGVHMVGLAVLNPTGMFFDASIPYAPANDEGLQGGTWHWPERS